MSAGGVVEDECPLTLAQITAKAKADGWRTIDVERIGLREGPIPGEFPTSFQN